MLVQTGNWWKPSFEIRKFADDLAFRLNRPYEIAKFSGNMLLQEGRFMMQTLITGGSEGTPYDHDHAYVGVGDSDIAVDEYQTGLQAAVNLAFAPMDTTFPQVAGVSALYQGTFGAAAANFDWKEFTVVNGPDDTWYNMFRKVSDQGTKPLGQTWQLGVTVSLTGGSI